MHHFTQQLLTDSFKRGSWTVLDDSVSREAYKAWARVYDPASVINQTDLLWLKVPLTKNILL